MIANKNSHHDQTAQALATHCYQLKQQYRQPICLQNVCALIDQEKVKHDLIAFQEASNWKQLIQNSHRLSKMKSVQGQKKSSVLSSIRSGLGSMFSRASGASGESGGKQKSKKNIKKQSKKRKANLKKTHRRL